MMEEVIATYDELNECYVAVCPYCQEPQTLTQNQHNYLFIYGEVVVECEDCHKKFLVTC